MSELSEALIVALRLIARLDADLLEIVLLSLRVSLSAILCATPLGLAVGAFLGVKRHFVTRGFWLSLLNALMGLPPVVVGLLIYLVLSRSGPLAPLELLYTPTAMIIAQAILAFPIIASLTCQTMSDHHAMLSRQLRAFGCQDARIGATLLWEARYSLVTAAFAGFGRAIAEVGAVLIVGGNIYHATRVMTTTIALETSKGNIALALALGLILILLSLLIMLLAQSLRNAGEARLGLTP